MIANKLFSYNLFTFKIRKRKFNWLINQQK